MAVDVVIPARSNQILVDAATRANSKPVLDAGVRIWRCPPPFRQSKLMVVDGTWSLLGSCNWDTRSFRLNFELCVEVYDQTLASQLETLMESCRGEQATQAELDRQPLPARLRDQAARLLLPYL